MNNISRTYVHIKDLKTFDDLYNITSKLKPKEKGDLFELVTFYIFKLSPTLNNKLQDIWLYNDIPIKIKRLLKLPEKDKGIDLLAVIDDKYYAIQSKFRQNKNSIVPWADLSTFFGLSFGINDKIKGGFFVTNTYDLCDEVINSDKVEPIYGDFFDNLPNNFFSNIAKIINKQKTDEYVCKTPLKHQLECINKCDEYFKNNNRGYIEMACGSGKTLTSYWVDKKMNNRLTLVLVPSLYLLSQFYQDWVNQSYSENIKINYILIGSDADVSEDTKYKSNGLILEMDPVNIKQLIEKHKNEKTVVICTYQSSDKLFNTADCFDMCTFDEAHKTVGQTGKQFSLMIKDSENEQFNESDEEDEENDDEDEDLDEEFDGEEAMDDLDEEIDDSNLSEDFENSDLEEEMEDSDPDDKIEENHFDEEIDENNVDEKTDDETEEENLDGEPGTGIQNIKISKRLFMTATPKNYAGNLDDEQIISMDNEKYYGKEIFSYNTGKAIEDKRLVDYQLLTMVAQNKEIQQSISSNKLVKYKKLLDNEESNYLAIVLIILKKMHDGTCNHMVTYHNAIKRSKKFADLLIKINKELYKEDIFIESLDGSISMVKRNRIIKEFAAGRKGILCSAKVLNEGVNIPIIDSVCFVDNRNSTIDIVQCIGRSLRLYENKKIANIIVPIFIDNLDDVIENSIFGSIISILKALKSTDEGITEYFVHNENGKNGSKRNIFKYEMYGRITKDIEINLGEWKNRLETTIWKIVDPFESVYDRLKKWIHINKRIPFESSKNIEEKKLGKWCSHRREDKKKNKVDGEKVKKLEKLDGWFWNFAEDLFDDMYKNLKIWINNNKRLPSQISKNLEEKKLGIWCVKKRQDKKKNKLGEEKIRKLEELHDWYWGEDTVKEIKTFDEMYELLKIWIDGNKRLPSSQSKNKEERKFGKWCSGKRQDKKKNKLDEEKIKKLEVLGGWFWSENIIKEVKSFDEMHKKLKIWIDSNGKLPSKESKDQEERKLGLWCSNKRNDKKNNKLDEEKIKKLEELDNWFWNLDPFDEMYEELKIWTNNSKRLPSCGSKNQEEKKLGKWCSRKRHDKKNNKLDEEKIKKLEELDDWYWGEDTIKEIKTFDEMYELLKIWIDNNKRLPSCQSKNQEERKLGQWCSDKRQYYKKNKLDEEKIKKLEELDGWFWGENIIKEVKSFDEIHERLEIWIYHNKKLPSCMSKNLEEKNLGSWCVKKRRDKKNNKLDEEKIKKLEELGYWYWNMEDLFDETYEKLKIWINDNKRLPSEESKNLEEKKLGRWCSSKRQDKKKNKLDEEKIKKLEKLDIWFWNFAEDLFDETYEKLKTWINNNKKMPTCGSKNIEEKKLGSWCSYRREDKKKNKLDDNKIKKLEELDGWFWNLEDSFDEIYILLNTWINNNKKLPSHGSKNLEEKKLGSWCSKKRQDKRNNKLDEEKIKKLEEINGWYWEKTIVVKGNKKSD